MKVLFEATLWTQSYVKVYPALSWGRRGEGVVQGIWWKLWRQRCLFPKNGNRGQDVVMTAAFGFFEGFQLSPALGASPPEHSCRATSLFAAAT